MPLRNLAVPFTVPVQSCRAEDCRSWFTVLRVFPPDATTTVASWENARALGCPFCGRELS